MAAPCTGCARAPTAQPRNWPTPNASWSAVAWIHWPSRCNNPHFGEGALAMGNFFFRALLLGLGLATALPAAAGIDCNAPASWAQDTICRSKALSEMQREMETLAADARARKIGRASCRESVRTW